MAETPEQKLFCCVQLPELRVEGEQLPLEVLMGGFQAQKSSTVPASHFSKGQHF